MAPWEAIIEKVPEECRTLLAAAAALAMTMMATMLALTADAHVLALVDDLLRENVQRLDFLGRQGRQDAIGPSPRANTSRRTPRPAANQP